MYDENDLLAISGLQHLAFCPRQCALIHLERIWDENYLTASGRVMHDYVHNAPSESRGDTRTVRGLMLRSRRLGLFGVADVIEFHRIPDSKNKSDPDADNAAGQDGMALLTVCSGSIPMNHVCNTDMQNNDESLNGEMENYPVAVPISNRRGLWQPYPVEYKHGRPKANNCDAVQLCAQAMCLEEMIHCSIREGSLYYGQTRHRLVVTLDDALRNETEQLAAAFHALIEAGQTPPPVASARCKACSLADDCFPGIRPNTVMNYLQKNWKEAELS